MLSITFALLVVLLPASIILCGWLLSLERARRRILQGLRVGPETETV